MKTGAQSLVETALGAGVEVCFANPGTTEMPIVLAMDRVPGMRVVLGLFEGVCTGAADGWGRMTGRPAATLLHLGPGFANGVANLHNARRGRSPVVNWIGDHATRHLPLDSPLTSDIAALAGSVGWTRTIGSPAEMSEASLAAVRAALGAPAGVASLIIPADCQWEEGPDPLSTLPSPIIPDLSSDAPREAARLLRANGAGLLIGGNALTERGLRAAARVVVATGCAIWIETFPSRLERGIHVPGFPLLPYFPEQAREALADVANLVLAGAREPISFFAYPDRPSRFLPEDAAVHSLADPDSGTDAALALEALAHELGAPVAAPPPRLERPGFKPTGRALDPDGWGRTMAAFVPENAIVVNEAATTGLFWSAVHSRNAAPHTMLWLTGGSIGQGLPNALGAALACPDRRVIALQADGSGLYTLQALWSMAREGADVIVVVCANRRYRILQVELARVTGEPGPKARSLTDLTQPVMDWVALARGFGVPGCRAETDAELAEALGRALAGRGPVLIEAVLA